MLSSKIRSKYIFQELFSFVNDKKKLKLIKGNSFMQNKLDITIKDFQILFFQKKIYNYDYDSVVNYYDTFINEYESIIENEEDLDDIFFDCLSKLKKFDLDILDKDFNLIITNPNFQKDIRIKLQNLVEENFPQILLIKHNSLSEKAMKVFKEIFIENSKNETINKSQLNYYLQYIMKNKVQYDSDYILNNYDTDHDGLLKFDDFCNFHLDLIKKDINIIWKFLNSLGYNNLLDKSQNNDINYFLNHMEEFNIKSNSVYFYLNKLSKIKVHKITLFNNISKEYIYFLSKSVFQNINRIDILISNLNQLIELQIICYNVEEVNLTVVDEDLKYDFNQLVIIFPNIKIFNIYLERNLNLFDLLNNLTSCELTSLKIVIYNSGNNFNYKINNQIILKKIRNLEIFVDEGYNINDFLFNFFNNVQFPSLKEYILHFDLNQFTQQNLIFDNNNDFNIINNFLIKTLKKKNRFELKSFFNLLNQLHFIRYFKLDLRNYVFIYKKKREEKYLFKFNLNNIDEFRKYYSNFDLSIDQKEILQYKKIDIKGIKYGNSLDIENIIEKEDINTCDIYFNINQKQYFINSIKYLRSIYSEEEIEQKDLLIIMNLLNDKTHLDNLKYINISLGDVDISILSKIIKKCNNLKSLILRLHPNNFYQNIIFFLSLIKNSKKLQIIKITSKNNLKINLEEKLKDFPKIIEKKYFYKEFIIGNESFISRQKKRKNILNFNIKCIYDIKNNLIGNEKQLLNDNREIKDSIILYLNNKIVNSLKYTFQKSGKYKLNIILTKPLTKADNMFYKCPPLIFLYFTNFNTDNIDSMSSMFRDCSLLTSLNLSNFNTEKVKDMSYMFYNCSSLFSLNLENFNTNNVEDMSYMFSNCSSLISLNLSNFNTNNVKDMKNIFYNCSSLTSLDLSNINTINIKDMSGLFCNCSSLTTLDLSNFKTNDVLYMNCIFYNCSSLVSLNLSNFNTKKVKNMNNMFSKCTSLSSLDISNFITYNVKDMSYMFYNCSSLSSLNLSNFKTYNVNNMSYMFYKCCSLKSLDLSNFNTEKVNTMIGMFSNCSSLISLNLSNFNTDEVKDMSNMFYKCSSLNSLTLSNFNTNNIVDMSYLNNMFFGIREAKIIISNDNLINKLINK